MDLIMIIAYLALLLDIYITIYAAILLVIFKNKKLFLIIFISETCNGFNSNNCLSC